MMHKAEHLSGLFRQHYCLQIILSLYNSIRARNLCLSLCVCVCVCVCVCFCESNISGDQDHTDLRLSTWLLCGSVVCIWAFAWTAMIPWINYFINALQIPQALSTGATTVTCAPEPITAEPTATPHLKKQAELYLQWCELDGILPAVRSRSVLCI